MTVNSVLHVDMDAFYASVERNRKDLEGPVVVCVYSGRSENSGAVSTCSYDARELGIHAAMPITQAKNKAEDSEKEVSFVGMDREYYREVSDEIREEIFESFSDKIEQASIDEAYLEIEKDIEEAEEIAQDIQEEVLEKFNLTCSIGIGPNKLVAKVASDREKPQGLTVVRDEDVKDFMFSLELEGIHGIGKRTVDKLKEKGIKSVEDLAEADESLLVREFGEKQGLKLKQKALGREDSKVEEQGQKQITRITTLGENSRRPSYIKKYFPELAAEIIEKAMEKKVGFRKVSLVVIDTDIEMHTRITSLKSYVQDKNLIIEKGDELIKEFIDEFEGEVRRIGLRIKDLKEIKNQRKLEEF